MTSTKSIVLYMCQLVGTCILSSCIQDSTSSNQITFIETDNPSGLVELIQNIECIPLETDDFHILGFTHNLYLAKDGSFVIADTNNGNIYRYSSDGKFMNAIGHKGNGPTEFSNINNIQIDGNLVYIYSRNGKRLSYSLDGTFINKDKYDDLGSQSFTTESGTLTYFGYGSGRGHRFGLYSSESSLKYLIPSAEKVINLTANTPIYSKFGDKLFVVDSYNDNVMLFHSGKIQDYCRFNLGKYQVPKDFFTFENAMDAMQFLTSKPYALINSYQESESYSYVEVNIQGDGMPKRSYGIKHNDKWNWFSLGILDKEPLAGQVYLLEDNYLYCMMDPILIENLQNSIYKKIVNPDVLNGLSSNSNYVIAKIKLK